MLSVIAFTLFFRFLWGWQVGIYFISRKESSERFLKISYFVYLGFWITCLLFLFQLPSAFVNARTIGCMGMVLGALTLYSFFSSRAIRIAGFVVSLVAPIIFLPHQEFLSVFNFVTGAGVLGGVFLAMFLGHWFLNVPKLHIRELYRINKIALLALSLKFAEVLTFLFYRIGIGAYSEIEDLHRFNGLFPLSHASDSVSFSSGALAILGESYFGLAPFGLIVLSARILWGLIAPIVLLIMVHKTLELRSTQSATGILYAASVMVLFGECCALYINQVLKWAI